MRASISRTEVFAFVRSLGANPHDVRTVELGTYEATVTSNVRDEDGKHTGATQVTTIPYVGGDGDQPTVRMRHPNLDTEIDVPASAVGHHAVAGWEAVGDEPATPEPPADTKQPEPPAPGKPETPRRRKSTSKESDD